MQPKKIYSRTEPLKQVGEKNDEDFVSRAPLATTCEVFTLLLQTRYLTSQRSGSEKWSEKGRIMSQSSRPCDGGNVGHYPDIVLRLKQFHTSEKSRIKCRMRKRSERVKYFQHSKRNFVSPSCHVIVYFLIF